MKILDKNTNENDTDRQNADRQGMPRQRPTVIFAGGGTAGHVNPLLATLKAFKGIAPEYDRLVLGTDSGLEVRLVEQAKEELFTIEKLPLPRRPSLDLLSLPYKMIQTVKRLRVLMRERRVVAVVGFGGYVSTPAYLAAWREKIPVFIHEQNAVPGLANKLGARIAQVVVLTFSKTPLSARRGLALTLGLPLRQTIAKACEDMADPQSRLAARDKAFKFFATELGNESHNFDPEQPLILVTGGSLGAQKLNEVLPLTVSILKETYPNLQIIHLTGKGKSKPVKDALKQADTKNYLVLEYLERMDQAMSIADMVICRAGAATVAENCAFGLPAIYIPLAIGNGEQAYNARESLSVDGAQLISEKNLTATTLAKAITRWMEPKARQEASQKARSLGKVDAADKFAKLIVNEIKQ